MMGSTVTATALILTPGETLGGFRIRDVLGLGGMAVVYRAEQLSLHREVALKVLSAELGKDEEFAERFRREGMLVSQLDHPNIIPIYDAGSDKGRLFLAMRLVEGLTLGERIRADPLSASEIVRILGPIADGLDCAHSTGLVHRDVKPQNILLTERGHPYLTDFGVAKRVDTAGVTAAGGFVGSFHYAAPEQVHGTPTSAATDVYALTVVLYQCLTGVVPYADHTDAGALFAQISQPPPRLAVAEAQRLNAVIAQGMAKSPDDRFASAGDLIAAAERALGELPADYMRRRPTFPARSALTTGQHALTEAARLTRRPRRRGRPPRTVIALGAGLAVVAGVLAGLLLSGGGPARAATRTAHSGGLSIVYRSPWTPTHSAIGSFVTTPVEKVGGPAPIELASGRTTMTAGALGESSVIPGGLPRSLVTRFGHATPTLTRLQDGSAVARYHWSSVGGRSLDAWVIPTVRGDIVIICAVPIDVTAGARDCAGMAAEARLRGVALLAVGPDTRLARSLREVAGRAAGSHGALAADGRGRPWAVSTMASLASGETRAARKLGSLNVPKRYASMVSGLATALDADASALKALARADRTHDKKQYVAASRTLGSASRRLQAASRKAAKAGLRGTAFSALTVPPWRVVAPPQPSAGTGSIGSSTPTNTGTTPSPSAQPYVPPTSSGTGSGSGGGGTTTTPTPTPTKSTPTVTPQGPVHGT
jgi:hypothetical protein